MEEKRFFFGLEIEAAWQKEHLNEKYIEAKYRHITFWFLGKVKKVVLEKIISDIILPKFKIGPSGILEDIFILKDRNVFSYKAFFFEENKVLEYRKILGNFLEKNFSFSLDKRKFLPHVTICRKFLQKESFIKDFKKLPFFIKSLTLYESLGNSRYKSIFSNRFIFPFEEIEHTADIAFIIRGKNYFELFVNGFTALCFKNISFVNFFIKKKNELKSIDDVIILLNDLIAKMDMEIGSSFKAVSFSSKIKSDKNKILEWEMIVDV